jgi:hypothetical protein
VPFDNLEFDFLISLPYPQTRGTTRYDHGGVLTVWTTHYGTASYVQAFLGSRICSEKQRIAILRPGSNLVIGWKIRWEYRGLTNYSGLFRFQVGSGIRNLEATCFIR